MQKNDRSVSILGAGLAGLAAGAWLFENGCQVQVYEKEAFVGGHAASHEINGFVFDQGPHISFTKKREIQELLAGAVADQFIEHDASILNYWHGYWFPHPVQVNLFGLPVEIVERSLVDFVSARYEDQRQVSNYADWCYKRLGQTISEEFVFRYTRKYWAIDPQQMTTDWIKERVYSPGFEEVVRGSLAPNTVNKNYITHFRYPKAGGFGAYTGAFANLQDIRTGSELVEIDLQHKALFFANGQKEYYENLISSLPLPELLRMIRDVPGPVAAAAEKLACTSLVLVNLGLDRPDGFPEAHWMYFYDEDLIFSRASLPHKLSPGNVPPGCGSMQMEVYYSRYKPLPSIDVKSRVLEDLTAIHLISPADHILVEEQKHVKYANVLYDQPRKVNLQIVLEYLAQQGIVPCGRYGEWEYYWTDDSILSGRRAAQTLLASAA
jgi:protoporphyrinogen oxidase